MRSVPKLGCVCWRVKWPLVGEELPDHVCEQIQAVTVYNGRPVPGAELTPSSAWLVFCHSGDFWGEPSRQLALILREWAQEEPNRTLANQLRESWV